VPAVVGARLAFPRDSLKVAMRSSILTLGVGVMVCVVAMWVAAGFDRLADEPPRHGWAWDLTALNGGGYQPVSRPLTNQLLEGAGATGWSFLSFGALRSADVEFPAFGLEPGRGSVTFTLLEGRMPAGADEIALGSTTLRDIGASLGERVQLTGEQATREAVVVGRVVLPALAPADASRPQLGRGAVMTQLGLEARHGPIAPSAILVEARPGDALNLEQRIIDRLPTDRALDLLHDQQTGELRAWKDDLEQTPIIAVSLAAVLLAGVLAHSVALTVRRRGKELAVLRALGITARQIGSALRSQTLWMTASGLAIGLPVGMFAGILIWRHLAQGVGVANDTAWPVISILLVLLLSLVVAAITTWYPSRRTNRSTIADSLRTE
jgi:FtsX-like permease family